MKQYVDEVVANGEQILHLFLDYASAHRTLPIRLHCSMRHIQMHYIPANTTHILQVNDLVVFVQLKEHLSHMHNRLITEQQLTATLQHDVEYAAHYLLNKLKRDIIPFCWHFVANATIVELRLKNNVFKLYDQYHTIEAFNARPGMNLPSM